MATDFQHFWGLNQQFDTRAPPSLLFYSPNFFEEASCFHMSMECTPLGWLPSVADWGGGMSAGCTTGPIVHWCGQWMTSQCSTVSLAHATAKIVKCHSTWVNWTFCQTAPQNLPFQKNIHHHL